MSVLSPESETVLLCWGSCFAHAGVGDIALGACVMAMPIVERPSCLTCPSAREALALLSPTPWLACSRFGCDFESASDYTET